MYREPTIAAVKGLNEGADVTTATVQANKDMIWAFWQRLAGASPDSVADIVLPRVHADVEWTGPHPINHLDGAGEVVARFWQPLLRSFPDLRRETDVFLGGEFDAKQWVCGTGYFVGTFAYDWLDIPATGRVAHIRFGEFCAVRDGQIAENYLLLDLIDVMLQAGYRVLPPSNGDEAKVPAPRTGDGVLLDPQDDAASAQSLALVEGMMGSMRQYDLNNPATLSHTSFWRTDMCWYGPCGIGTARSMDDYFPVHQRPFLEAFPDRRGAGHKARLAEGGYIASTGWPSVRATHTGPWLGQPPTGGDITMRVMDFWRREGELLAENWVLIDIPDIFRQCGVDLFARLAEQAGTSAPKAAASD